MCGLAGVLGPAPLDPDRVEAGLRALAHRGPDAHGVHRAVLPDGRHLTLLHARLSIIDLDPRSDQPMRRGDDALAFNGEVYDAPEIRARHGWDADRRTDSDTETLLRLLATRGPDGLDEAEGMWAFAWHDAARGRVVLGRDRFGEKPLFLWAHAGAWWFGSEPKALFALAGTRARPDLAQVRRFLVNGYKSLWKDRVRCSFLEGVHELPPATTLDVAALPSAPAGAGDAARAIESAARPYWRADGIAPDESMGFEDAVATVRDALVRSVELRLRADVPLAFMLSGGVDSTALVSIARRELGREVSAFTILCDDERYDESRLVAGTVAELGVAHHPVRLETEGFLSTLRTIVAQHDAPVCTISYYAHWLLMRAVAGAGATVSVSGTGADELLTGYYDHHLQFLAEVKGTPAHDVALADFVAHVAPTVRNPFLRDPERFVREPGFRDHVFLDREAFAACLLAPCPEPFAETVYEPGLLRNRMLNELRHEVVPAVLHEDDRNAMAFSIENRSPYLDRGLFETCRCIPVRHLVRGGYRKAVLREAVRGIAPDAVLDERRKVGFNAPIDALLDRADPATRAEVLSDSPVWDVVRRDAVEALLDAPALPNSRSKFLFSVLSVRAFLDEHAP